MGNLSLGCLDHSLWVHAAHTSASHVTCAGAVVLPDSDGLDRVGRTLAVSKAKLKAGCAHREMPSAQRSILGSKMYGDRLLQESISLGR
jgi:hypothetical protein